MSARFPLSLAGLLVGCGLACGVAADEPRFDVNVADAPARAFFEGLVDGTPYNVMLEPGVGGTVTVRLKNVTVGEALDAVREAYGYDYRRIPSGYVIVPPSLQTRIFQVNYLDLERRGTSRTRVTSGQISQGASPQMAMAQQGAPGGGMPTTQNQLSEPPGAVFGRNAEGRGNNVADITGTSISTRSASDFWHDLENSLKLMVAADGGRGVVVNPQSGVIAVRASPRELRDVTEFLAKIQDTATRQVVLEAKIVEVELSDGFQAGINWALIGRRGGQTFSGFQTNPQQGFGNQDLFNQPSAPVTLGPGNPVTSTITNTLGGAFSLAINAADFNAFIDLLGTQGKTRVLSSPRVSTLNNQKAVIKAGSDEFFVTGVQSNTVVGTSSATNLNVDLTPFFSGVALDVTPQIAADRDVILHIHPSVSDVTTKVLQFNAGGGANGQETLPLAYSQVRESDSIVKAKSGQLIVIGGLLRASHNTEDYRVPLLGDIPVLGNLFKSQKRVDVRSELVILLRPIVVDSDEQWQALTDESLAHATAVDPKAAAGVR
ncbi:MAG: pilus (MSHA type) biogenesis protein MshL [Proteobacteria bacterium]|nr:pilus (MSHA type) biogenesis protein MshL [Pseudomonadota bacterium]